MRTRTRFAQGARGGCSREGDVRTGLGEMVGVCLRARGAGKVHGKNEKDEGQGRVYGLAFQDRES